MDGKILRSRLPSTMSPSTGETTDLVSCMDFNRLIIFCLLYLIEQIKAVNSMNELQAQSITVMVARKYHYLYRYGNREMERYSIYTTAQHTKTVFDKCLAHIFPEAEDLLATKYGA